MKGSGASCIDGVFELRLFSQDGAKADKTGQNIKTTIDSTAFDRVENGQIKTTGNGS